MKYFFKILPLFISAPYISDAVSNYYGRGMVFIFVGLCLGITVFIITIQDNK